MNIKDYEISLIFKSEVFESSILLKHFFSLDFSFTSSFSIFQHQITLSNLSSFSKLKYI